MILFSKIPSNLEKCNFASLSNPRRTSRSKHKTMSKRIVFLTGAGVSAESGLQTFRDNGGLWDNYDPMVVASIEGWESNPGLVLDFYNVRRDGLAASQPNLAHRLIAALEQRYWVDVVTQNVDNLHERAGSSHVLHLHGELTKVRPENSCNAFDLYSEELVQDIGYGHVVLGDKAPNGSQLRPHIVFFGEAVPKMDEAISLVEQADMLVIVGTSLQVYPAAGLYRYARPTTPIYIIDPAGTELRDARVQVIKKPATEGMRELCDRLGDKFKY